MNKLAQSSAPERKQSAWSIRRFPSSRSSLKQRKLLNLTQHDNMNHTLTSMLKTAVVIVLTMLLVAALWSSTHPEITSGAAFPGGQATVGTTSFYAVTGGSTNTLFATSTACAARIISTQGSAIQLTFSNYAGQSPTGVNGFTQATSTTVSYDGEIYGCGLVKAYSYGAQTLTISETR